MKYWIVGLLVLICLAAWQSHFLVTSAKGTEERMARTELQPQKEYRGVMYVGGPGESDPPGGLLLIRDQKALDNFVARIPTREITPTSPAPPSDDPLLSHPSVNFQRSMMVVAYSGSMLTEVDISRTGAENGAVVVSVQRQDCGYFSSVPVGIGCYHAVILEKTDGPVREEAPSS